MILYRGRMFGRVLKVNKKTSIRGIKKVPLEWDFKKQILYRHQNIIDFKQKF